MILKQEKSLLSQTQNIAKNGKKVPHYWLQDKQGNVYDPTGYIQFVKTGLAKGLDASRYLGSQDSRI